MPKLGISFQIWFFPQFWGKKWRRSEHALASNTGLSLFPPGFQAHFQGGVRGSPGTGLDSDKKILPLCSKHVIAMSLFKGPKRYFSVGVDLA